MARYVQFRKGYHMAKGKVWSELTWRVELSVQALERSAFSVMFPQELYSLSRPLPCCESMDVRERFYWGA
jgi:hypothetical protein